MASWRNPGDESSTMEDAGGELYFFLQVNVLFSKNEQTIQVIAGSLESAYSLIWGSHKIWGKGGGDTLDLL